MLPDEIHFAWQTIWGAEFLCLMVGVVWFAAASGLPASEWRPTASTVWIGDDFHFGEFGLQLVGFTLTLFIATTIGQAAWSTLFDQVGGHVLLVLTSILALAASVTNWFLSAAACFEVPPRRVDVATTVGGAVLCAALLGLCWRSLITTATSIRRMEAARDATRALITDAPCSASVRSKVEDRLRTPAPAAIVIASVALAMAAVGVALTLTGVVPLESTIGVAFMVLAAGFMWRLVVALCVELRLARRSHYWAGLGGQFLLEVVLVLACFAFVGVGASIAGAPECWPFAIGGLFVFILAAFACFPTHVQDRALSVRARQQAQRLESDINFKRDAARPRILPPVGL